METIGNLIHSLKEAVAPSPRVEKLLAELTVEEKCNLLAGKDFWRTYPVERLNIPQVKVTDGPNGARGDSFTAGQFANAFPAGIALAATWDEELIYKVGKALGQEVRSKSAQVLLAPTVNMHRTPLNGRNFECYSEDPYLTGKLATAYINGVQSEGVGATVKHFVCNDSEFQRDSINVELGERAFREIYLAPFQMAVRDADPWCIMSSYNKVRGLHAAENPYTLQKVLRDDWGFNGLVMSDWFGVKSVEDSVKAGNDLEMPGPTRFRGEKLIKALQEGKITIEEINTSVRRVLQLIERSGKFENPEEPPEEYLDSAENKLINRMAAAEAIVLVKNENDALPMHKESLKSVAIVGVNAKESVIMGGGSATVKTKYIVSPYEGITSVLGPDVEVTYERGTYMHKFLPTMQNIKTRDGQAGYRVEIYNSKELPALGHPASDAKIMTDTRVMLTDAHMENVEVGKVSARLTTTFTPQVSGDHEFSLISIGLTKLYVNNELVVDNWTDQKYGGFFFGWGSTEEKGKINLKAGETYDILVEYSIGDEFQPMLRFGCLEPTDPHVIEKAAAAAAKTDAAIVFVGTNNEWETEGYDRDFIELPCQQNELVEAVAAANKNTIVVINSGGPVTMPWLDKVAGVLLAWYPGQEAGNAIADVLFGKTAPCGRLPQTFPVRLEDNPAFVNYPGENGKVHYGEGIFIGYRWYDKKKIKPFLPFGYGLSYTTFDYTSMKLDKAKLSPTSTLKVSVDVTNSGKVASKEVVQVYVRDVQSRLIRPDKELKGFTKVFLNPGETKTVEVTLDKYALGYYDDKISKFVAEEEGDLVTVPITRFNKNPNWKDAVAADLNRIHGFHSGLHKRAISVPAINEQFSYIANVGAGSPAQTFQLIVDTGSSNTWFGANTAYIPTSTSKSTGTVSVSYGSGSFSGNEYTDTVNIGALVLTGQSIGVATSSTGFSGVDGILGVGPTDLTQGTVSNANTVPTVVDTAYSEGKISSKVLGVYFQPTTAQQSQNGELTLGGADTSKYTGTLTYTSLTTTSPASYYWGINLSIKYGSTSISSTIPGIISGAALDNNTGLVKIPSSSYSNLQTISFVIAGRSFTLTPTQYIIPQSEVTLYGGTPGSYYSYIGDNGAADGLDFILGQKFLENYYSVFDTTNKR
ncbi:hypothetical protein BZG36_05126, partial [Bifiguratus adelaidae]